jgi:putative transposase
MNRATRGQVLFADDDEYFSTLGLLARALEERPIPLLAFSLMPNHFHMLLWPSTPNQVSSFVQWFCATHATRHHQARGTRGRGAVYQSRFKAAPVNSETHFYRVARYVERNAMRANLVPRAEIWPWGSASLTRLDVGIELAPWPVAKPPHWVHFLNDTEPPGDLAFIRHQTARGEPIGRRPLVRQTSASRILIVEDEN